MQAIEPSHTHGVKGIPVLNVAKFIHCGIIATGLDGPLDPVCLPIAETMNGHHVKTGRFLAATADMYDIDYHAGGHE